MEVKGLSFPSSSLAWPRLLLRSNRHGLRALLSVGLVPYLYGFSAQFPVPRGPKEKWRFHGRVILVSPYTRTSSVSASFGWGTLPSNQHTHTFRGPSLLQDLGQGRGVLSTHPDQGLYSPHCAGHLSALTLCRNSRATFRSMAEPDPLASQFDRLLQVPRCCGARCSGGSATRRED